MRRMRWTVAAVALGVAMSVATAGCTAARNTLGTSASRCFRSLPAANDAVHDRGQLVGVRYVKAGSLDGAARHSQRLREMIASKRLSYSSRRGRSSRSKRS